MSELMDLLYSKQEPQVLSLPSGRTATILEMTGQDQRNFSDRAKIANGTALNELLAHCVDSIDGAPVNKDELLDLLSADRKTLLFNIRKYSLGSDFRFTAKCPQCGKSGEWEVSLEDTEFKTTPYKCGHEVKTIEAPSKAKPDLIWKFQMLDGHAELKALKLRNKANNLSDLDLRQVQARLNREGEQFTPVNLDKMPDTLIADLRAVIKLYEGDLDDSVLVTCGDCNGEVSFNLMSVPDFLIPGATS